MDLDQIRMVSADVSEKNLSTGSETTLVAWILEQFYIEAGLPVDRPMLRRVLDEARLTVDFDAEDAWWRWLTEASRSLGLKCKILDCTIAQIEELSSEGARIIVRSEVIGRWQGIGNYHKNKVLVLDPKNENSRRWIPIQRLRLEIGRSSRDSLIRCVVFEPQLTLSAQGADHSDHPDPFDRLLAILRPEVSDINIVLVFALVTGLLTLATPLAVETLVNTVAFGRVLQPVVILALMLLSFLAFSSFLRVLQTYVVEIIQRRLFARVSADLSYRLPRVEMTSIDGQDGRELVNRFFDIVTVQKVSAGLLLDGISLILGTLIGMAVLAFYHPWLLGFDVILIALIAFIVLVLGRGAITSSIKESKSKYRMAAWFEELIGNPTAFRYNGAAEFAMGRVDQLTYEYLSARKKHFRILLRQISFALGLQAIASTVLLGLGGWLVISGQLTLGQLVAAELIVTVIVGSFAKLGKHMESYYDLLAAVDKLGQLFDLPMERQDGIISVQTGHPSPVTLVDVSYQTAHGKPVLNGFDLRVEPGERLAIQGPSGSGKSLLLDLLYGIRAPLTGHVTVHGLDPRDLRPDALRKQVALVRDREIFAGSIEENVHLERPDISTYDVRNALEQVGLIDDILRLPEGLDTKLVSKGYPLTRNQSRKLMLARAIVGRPSLLLIDGLIDALPDDDAIEITNMLIRPEQPWTLIVVTGRESVAELLERAVQMKLNVIPKSSEVVHAS